MKIIEKFLQNSPNKDEQGLNIHRVPTFIIYKEGKEVNRIVEFHIESFEKNLLKISTLNTLLFPNESSNYERLGYFYYTQNNKQEA